MDGELLTRVPFAGVCHHLVKWQPGPCLSLARRVCRWPAVGVVNSGPLVFTFSEQEGGWGTHLAPALGLLAFVHWRLFTGICSLAFASGKGGLDLKELRET